MASKKEMLDKANKNKVKPQPYVGKMNEKKPVPPNLPVIHFPKTTN